MGVLVADLVGVFAKAGQQNLTEWLKGVMRSYESGGVILDVQVDIRYEPGGAMLSSCRSYFVDPVSSIVCQCCGVRQRSKYC